MCFLNIWSSDDHSCSVVACVASMGFPLYSFIFVFPLSLAFSFSPYAMQVILGEHDQRKFEGTEQLMKTEHISWHPRQVLHAPTSDYNTVCAVRQVGTVVHSKKKICWDVVEKLWLLHVEYTYSITHRDRLVTVHQPPFGKHAQAYRHIRVTHLSSVKARLFKRFESNICFTMLLPVMRCL